MTDNLLNQRVEPAPYLTRLESYLRYVRNTEYYPGLLYSYTDIRRFEPYLSRVEQQCSLDGRSVLDLGAGTGGLLLACQQHGAARLVGVEVDPELYELAQLRLVDTGIEFILTDGDTIPLPDESFDVIISIHVIEHVISPAAYLREVARLLKPDGGVLLTCPNRLWPREPHAQLPFLPFLPISWAKALCHRRSRSEQLPASIRQQYYTGTLLNHYFSFWGLRRLCRQAGLEFVEANPTGLFCAIPEVSFAAWGKAHPRFEDAFNSLNRGLIHDRIEPYVHTHPLSHFAHWLALTLSWEIGGVLRKVNRRATQHSTNA
jgi:ubiquinone/menaquinone biosynthesis C-methylase UbiE